MDKAVPSLPRRKILPHTPPPWVADSAVYFITVCGRRKGIDQFCRPRVFEQMVESIEFRIGLRQWWAYLILFMPDHLHGLVSYAPEPGMRKVTKDWKHFTASHFDIDWQRDFFDHRLRNHESYDEKAFYIRNNPVRAGLVEQAEDWPYVWENPVPFPPGFNR